MAYKQHLRKMYKPFGKRLLNFQLCNKCKLNATKDCKNIVHGLGNINSKIMFIGEAPGGDEDKESMPFIGKSGQLLRDSIEKTFKLSHNDFFYSNTIRCHPKDNRDPTKDEIAACNNHLLYEINIVKPLILIPLGIMACKAIIGSKFKSMNTSRLHIFSNDICQYIIPVAHPASTMYGNEAETISKKAKFKLDLKFARDVYLKHKNDDRPDIEIQNESAFNF